MSLFKLPNAGRNARVSDNHTVKLRSKPALGRTFIDSARKIARKAGRLFKGTADTHTRATQTILSPKTDRTNNTERTNHTMREVRFASAQRTARQASFPYRVEHRFTGSVGASRNAPGINALLPELSKSIQNKQGFVYLHDDASASPMAKFIKDFEDQDSIDIGNGCRIVGAFRTPAETASVYSPQWTLQVYDASIEATFEIPITEVPLSGINNPANTTAQLLHLKNCMDSHLKALPDAFKDSPSCPAIICPQRPRLAQLITAQEECLGRQYRGELHCQDGMEWILAAEDTLKTISPDSPGFVGEESVDFESFFNRSGLHAFSNNRLPFSIGLAGDNANDPNNIRAFKRHIPHTPEPRRQAAATPVATAVPLATAAPAAASTPRATEAPPATAIPVARAVPARNWLEERNQGYAFKEPQLQMQCASQAINCVMQRHELDPEQVASFLVDQKLGMLDELGIKPNTQAGLMHPTVVRAMQRGESLTISKTDFLGTTPDEMCISSESTPTDCWRRLINIRAVEKNQNWINNADVLSAINQITITPEDWLSVQRGTEMLDVLALVNATLTSSRQAHQPRSMTHLNTREHLSEISQLERRAQNRIARGQDFPIIVRSGQMAGHYYTIVPDQHGNWLGLNSMGTAITGVQRCEIFSRAGDLAQTLQRLNINDVLVPTPDDQNR